MGSDPKNWEQRAPAVEKVVRALEYLADEPDHVSFAEAGEALGLSRSAAHRLLTTLVAAGAAERDRRTGRYVLGPRVLGWGGVLLRRLEIRVLAMPYLLRLRELCGEAVSLHVPVGHRQVCVERVEGPREVRQTVQLGATEIRPEGATGRVLLAHLDATARAAVRRVNGDTPESAVQAVLESELARVREQGVAVSRDGWLPGLTAVSAAVLRPNGTPVAALTVSAPSVRATDAAVADWSRLLREAADALSQELSPSARRGQP